MEGLDWLIVGPYHWNAVTYSNFLRDVYENVLKTEVERLQYIEVENRKQVQLTKRRDTTIETSESCQNLTIVNQSNDVEVAQLVQSLVDESGKVFEGENWTEIIGPEVWDVLKLDDAGKDRYKLYMNDKNAISKRQSVVQLLKLIRNKISHIRTCKDDLKEKLKQFFDKDEKSKFEFNENKFAAFWISKFPKLVPYLWVKLYKFRDKLINYYPSNEIDITRFEDFFSDINQFEEKLKTSLFADLENGNVIKRFKGPHCSLEFRRLQEPLDKTVFFKFAANLNGKSLLLVTHLLTNEDKLEYVGSEIGSENFRIIFASNITDDRIWKYCNSCDCRVIVFCDSDKLTDGKVDEALGKFSDQNNLAVKLSEYPIKGCELTKEKQTWVLENGQLCIQGSIIKLKDIFPENDKLVEGLSGELLNKLLKQEYPIVFGEYKYPQFEDVYIERKLFFSYTDPFLDQYRQFLHSGLPQFDGIHIFVSAALQNMFCYSEIRGEIVQFENVDSLCMNRYGIGEQCKLILLHNPKKFSNELIRRCEDALHPRILYFCELIDQEVCTVFDTRFPIFEGEYRVKFQESEFLRNIQSRKLTTCIYAKSGMGKTKLLKSLAKKLREFESLVIFCSFRNFVDCLQNRIGNREVSVADVRYIIVEILKCTKENERYLAENWLERKGDTGAKIELQLDGLDEVPQGKLKLAFRAWKIIEQEFDSIRLWITSVKPFSDRSTKYKTAYCWICPFSYNQNLEFFELSWGRKYPELPKRQLKILVEKLFKKFLTFSDELLLPRRFTDSPLNCSILSELYEDNLYESKPFEGNAKDLYGAIYSKKFAIMYKNRYGVLNENFGDFKLLRQNYLQLHTFLALKHLFSENSKEFREPLAMRYLKAQDYCKMGIITDVRPLNFLHLAYADFFVARYIIKVLETETLDNLCSKEAFQNLLYFGMPDEKSESFRSSLWLFVDNYLEKITDSSSLNWLKTNEKESHPFFLRNEFSRFLNDSLESKMWNLARFLIYLWVNEQNTVVCNEILNVALNSGCPFGFFTSLCEKFSFDNEHDLVILSVKKGHYDIAKYLIVYKCGDDVFDNIAEIRKYDGGIFHCLVEWINEAYSYKITKSSDRSAENTIDFIRFVHRKSSEELERKDGRGRNFLLALPVIQDCRSCTFSTERIFPIREYLINELNADVNEVSLDGKCVLGLELYMNSISYANFRHYKEEFSVKNVKAYHKTLALVTSKNFTNINVKSNVNGLTPLQEAVHLFGPNLQRVSLDCFRLCRANFNDVFGRGDTILHYCVERCDNIEFIKLLVEYGCKFDVKNGENLCVLCLADKLGKVGMKTYFREKLGLSGEQTCGLTCDSR